MVPASQRALVFAENTTLVSLASSTHSSTTSSANLTSICILGCPCIPIRRGSQSGASSMYGTSTKIAVTVAVLARNCAEHLKLVQNIICRLNTEFYAKLCLIRCVESSIKFTYNVLNQFQIIYTISNWYNIFYTQLHITALQPIRRFGFSIVQS